MNARSSSAQKSLPWVLAAAFALRAVAAFTSLGADHPNETYRLLEPLAAQAGFATRLPWEWTDGLLSVLPIRFFSAWLALFPVGPLGQLRILKLSFAALSLLPIAATWRWLVVPRGRELAFLGAASMALWPEFIYRSVRLMDYTSEAALLAVAVIFAFTFVEKRVWQLAVAGMALGLAFFVRFQSGLYFIGILAAFAFARRDQRPRLFWVIAFVAAYGATIALLAALEARLTGAPFLSPFANYVHFNWFENGAARFYGTAPWHRYFTESLKALGILPFLIMLPLAAWESVKGNRRGVLFFLPFIVLSLLAHKEGRFEFGFLWLLVPLALSIPLSKLLPKTLSKKDADRVVLAMLSVFLIGFVLNLERVSRRWFLYADAVREWAAIGDQIAAMPDARRPSFTVVKADPDAVPGAFFLRLHGRLCYEYQFEGAAKQAGECAPPTAPDARIERDPKDGPWVLRLR